MLLKRDSLGASGAELEVRLAPLGVGEVYVQQIGPGQEQFFQAWADEVLPALR